MILLTDEEPIQMIRILIDSNKVKLKFMEDEEVSTEINALIENSGVTLQNIEYPIPVYYLVLVENFGTTMKCGNVINTFFTAIKEQIKNSIIVIDFNGIEEVSENFCAQYCKYILNTNNKILTINQDINVSNIFANFVLTNIDTLPSDIDAFTQFE